MSGLPPLAHPDRVPDAVLVVLCGIGQAASAALAAFATRDAFAALHAGNAIAPSTFAELVAAGLLGALSLFVSRRQSEALGQSYANALRTVLYRQIARLPKSYHEARRVGALSLRFVGDLSAARLWFGRGLPDVVTAIVVLPGAVAILFALDPKLAVACSYPIVIALALMIALAWRLEQRHKDLRGRRASLAISMIERIAISPELDLMGRTNRDLNALKERGDVLRTDAIARRSRTASLQAILQAGLALAGVSVLARGSLLQTDPASVAACLAVLALLSLPLQNLVTAWDQYCAWRVARGKAMNLLNARALRRPAKPQNKPPKIIVRGEIDGEPVNLTCAAEGRSTIHGPHGRKIARLIAGLDHAESAKVQFDESDAAPKTAFIGDQHIGLQGSLRRSASMLCRKRPKDSQIIATLDAYGLGHLVRRGAGLDTRIAEGGRNLSSDETLRLDLVRAELGRVDLLVIASVRWNAMSSVDTLLDAFSARCAATVVRVASAGQKENMIRAGESVS